MYVCMYVVCMYMYIYVCKYGSGPRPKAHHQVETMKTEPVEKPSTFEPIIHTHPAIYTYAYIHICVCMCVCM